MPAMNASALVSAQRFGWRHGCAAMPTTGKPAARAAKGKRAPGRKSATAKARAPVDLHAMGARVVSVFGPFNSRVLIEMSATDAAPLFPEPFSRSGRSNVIDGAEREIEAIRRRDAQLASTALAASAVALAGEIENPYNSATSKSMCAREMRDTLDRLRELAPEEERDDGVDDIKAQREKRRAERAAG